MRGGMVDSLLSVLFAVWSSSLRARMVLDGIIHLEDRDREMNEYFCFTIHWLSKSSSD